MRRKSWSRRGWSAALVGLLISAWTIAVPAGPAAAAGPCYFSGGTWFAVTCWGSTRPLTYESEEYAVPSNPTSGGANFALWGGLEDAAGDTVLQNILSWGGSSWSIYTEYMWGNTCNGCGHDRQGTHVAVKAGDTIAETLQAYNCTSAGLCTWDLTVVDLNSGAGSADTVGSGVSFVALLGAVFEVHAASGCVELPASGHAAFREIAVEDITGASPTPTFGNSVPDPQCSMRVESSSTSADFLWSP